MMEIQYKYGLKKGLSIDQEYIDKVLMEEEQAKANNYALRFLSHRQRSEKEIIDKLKEKGFEDKFIEGTLSYLKNYNLVDDMEFARSFANDKVNLNKYGPQRIKYDLYRKGISGDIIEEVLDYDDEYDRALELAEKKINSYKNDDRNAKYRKLGGFLQRRGYSYGCISKVLKEVLK